MPTYSGRVPTIPSQSAHPAERQPHQQRQMAESFGSDPERYDRSRPRYPDAMVEAIVAGSPGSDVVDVGCGTGIVARQFQAAGCRLLGVDVDARMAEFARRRGLAVEVASFEHWDPAGRTFDAVVSGQTWHWVDPIAGAAKAAEVLRPDGRLAVFWNAGQSPPELATTFAAVYGLVAPDQGRRLASRPEVGAEPHVRAHGAAGGGRRLTTATPPQDSRHSWSRAPE